MNVRHYYYVIVVAAVIVVIEETEAQRGKMFSQEAEI